jgi:outer membrane protein insertion porin family
VFAEPGQFKVSELRQSVGVSAAWFTSFLGLLEVSYAFPIAQKPFDRVERFQLNFGSGF